MAIPDARAEAYISVFRDQRGGKLPVFEGLGRYQSGQGIGDIFRGIWRRVVPIALNVGKAALNAFSGAQDEGASFKDAFKATLRPAASAAVRSTVQEIERVQKAREPASTVAAPEITAPNRISVPEIETARGKQPGIEQYGHGRRKRKRVYKRKSGKRKKQMIYNF